MHLTKGSVSGQESTGRQHSAAVAAGSIRVSAYASDLLQSWSCESIRSSTLSSVRILSTPIRRNSAATFLAKLFGYEPDRLVRFPDTLIHHLPLAYVGFTYRLHWQRLKTASHLFILLFVAFIRRNVIKRQWNGNKMKKKRNTSQIINTNENSSDHKGDITWRLRALSRVNVLLSNISLTSKWGYYSAPKS